MQCPACGAHFEVTASVLGTLTKRQSEILLFLETYATRGYMPSFEEIATAFDYTSLATVHEHLANLERKGYITRGHNEARAIAILPKPEKTQ